MIPQLSRTAYHLVEDFGGFDSTSKGGWFKMSHGLKHQLSLDRNPTKEMSYYVILYIEYLYIPIPKHPNRKVDPTKHTSNSEPQWGYDWMSSHEFFFSLRPLRDNRPGSQGSPGFLYRKHRGFVETQSNTEVLLERYSYPTSFRKSRAIFEFSGIFCWYTLPETNSNRTWKWMAKENNKGIF